MAFIKDPITGMMVYVKNNKLTVIPETDALNNYANVGCVRTFGENDNGEVTGVPQLMSPEVDIDYRQRSASDIVMDDETFNYTAQNTGKHIYRNTTMTNAWTVGAMTTNSGGVITTSIGTSFNSYAFFPIFGGHTLALDVEGSFTNQPTANTVINFGMFLNATSNPYAPTDGAYFRLSSAGLQGVVNYNGTETSTPVFVSSYGGSSWVYTDNKKYQFILYITPRVVEFWINDNGLVLLMGVIKTPIGNGTPCASSALPFAVRHAIVGGAAGAALSFNLARYNIRVGGANLVSTLGETGNRVFGSYQGLSGGTMGMLIGGSVGTGTLTNPTAAVPANNALTANLPSGLGGRAWETFTSGLAINTDGILCSYQVPAGTASIQGKRLKVTGVKMTAYVQTVMVGGPFNSEFMLAFGHTSVSLQTAEAASAKKPRLVLLPELTQVVTAAQAVNTMVSQLDTVSLFQEPIYVNPGEFIAFVVKHVGTIGTSGVIAYNIQYMYSWE